MRNGERSGIAYFEWSADLEDDPDDPDVWWRCMPALGITMTEDAVRHERDVTFAGKQGEFRRAYLNISTRSDERLIPGSTWDLVNSPDARPDGDMTFGIDMNPERSAAAISVVADGVLEVIDHRPGVGWLTARARELDDRWGEPFWAYDGRPSAPIASVIPELRREGLTLVGIDGPDLTAACGLFYDRVVDRQIAIRRHASLDAAIEGADRRFAGDAWTWDRRNSSVDISPLVAGTCAAWVDGEMSAPNVF